MKRILIGICILIGFVLFAGCSNNEGNLATDISFENEAYEIIVGEELVIDYVLIPEGASNKDVIWQSIDETVVTVDNGKVQAKEIGETKIVVYRDDVFKKEIEIIVKQKRAVDLFEEEESSFYYAFVRNISRFKEPSSIYISEIYESEDGKAWYIEVRGKNAFGGISSEKYTLTKMGTLTNGWYWYGSAEPALVSRSLINRALEERY